MNKILIVLVVCIVASCKNESRPDYQGHPDSGSRLEVMAFLIYKDGSISKENVLTQGDSVILNEKLNDIQYERDGFKTSNQTRIVIIGNLSNAIVNVLQGSTFTFAISKLSIKGHYEITVDNNSCLPAKLTITDGVSLLYEGSINFWCNQE